MGENNNIIKITKLNGVIDKNKNFELFKLFLIDRIFLKLINSIFLIFCFFKSILLSNLAINFELYFFF